MSIQHFPFYEDESEIAVSREGSLSPQWRTAKLTIVSQYAKLVQELRDYANDCGSSFDEVVEKANAHFRDSLVEMRCDSCSTGSKFDVQSIAQSVFGDYIQFK